MEHSPVLLQECIEKLNIKPNGTYVDGTLGRGGHALEIVKRLDHGRLIAIDRDADAVKEAETLLYGFLHKVNFVHDNFKDLAKIMDTLGIHAADGMLFDLGVSSPQLDDAGRGFSYTKNAPLDMRMDKRDIYTAFDVVNDRSEDQLRGIFYQFGEEKYAGRIAKAIVKKRAAKLIVTTFDLNSVILSAIPPSARREAQHPSKRCFQALRIAVNGELEAVSEMLAAAPDRLNPGGRLCVISFHSLEDRLVKNSFLSHVNGCKCPKDLPVCVCGFIPSMKVITKKPVIPGKDESERNPRARSAKLRVAEKL